MKKHKKILIGVIGIVLVMFMGSMVLAEEMKTITGIINDDGQLISEDGGIYDLIESEKASELSEMVGMKVIVTGNVSDNEGTFVIDVMDFEVAE